MPRYHFHLRDGVLEPDPGGTVLPDIREAQRGAAVLLGEILRENPESIWRDQELALDVADDRGLTLFTLTLTANLAPAMRS